MFPSCRRYVYLHVLIALVLLLAAPGAFAASGEQTGTVLITGSNRGIGLEFARQYAERGWQVIATCRSPARADELNRLAATHDNLSVSPLDITSADSVAALAKQLDGRPIDVMLNNAAYLGESAPQDFGTLDYALFEEIVAVNLIGPLRVTEALINNVANSQLKKIIILGSAAGSNGLLGPGLQLTAYRSSKAGLHMAAHQLAQTLAPRGILVGLINPGLVDTKGVLDLKPGDPVPAVFKPLLPLIESGQLGLMRPAESVTEMIRLIDDLGAEEAGHFWNVDGQELPW